jgi:hypothetical protein
MQLKLDMEEKFPFTTTNSAAQYSTVALCNKCGETHDMAVSVVLPTSLAALTNRSISCPNTGRQSIQKDKHQIYLVPLKH